MVYVRPQSTAGRLMGTLIGLLIGAAVIVAVLSFALAAYGNNWRDFLRGL